ncbi:MAG: hypothetical protein EOP00_18885 [Pedobacter sp.]|nr:MAG: hypothetical protein EOP00_18885 [Pedobacter sp.]
MKKRTKSFLFLGSILMVYGCNPSWDVNLYSQKIRGTNKIIYQYDAWGGRDSHKSGITILDSAEEFNMSKITSLPGSYFAEIPTKDYIKLIRVNNGENPTTEQDTVLKPSKHYFKNIKGIKYEVTEFNDTYGSSTMNTGLMKYEFEMVKETNDSLTFENVVHKFGGIKWPSKISFPKGNITVVDDTTGRVHRIVIEQFIRMKGEIYKPSKPLEIVTNQAIIGFATFYFIPKKHIKSSALTNEGIFKQVRK